MATGALSHGSLWLTVLFVSAAGFALEIAWSSESCYAVPALLRSGLEERYASMTWALSPLLGVLFQAWMGSASDRSGKRKPFILALAVMAWFGMASFAYWSTEAGDSGERLALVLVAFAFMDFSLDQFEPALRMLLLDQVPASLADKANYTYSALVATGSFLGSIISGVEWRSFTLNIIDTADEESADFDFQMRTVFAITMTMFLACVAATMSCIRERRTHQRCEKEPEVCSELSDSGTYSLLDGNSETTSNFVNGITESKGTHDRTLDLHTAASSEVHPLLCEGARQKPYQTFVGSIWSNLCSTVEFISYLSSATKLLWLMVILDNVVLISLMIFLSEYVGEVVYGGSPMAADSDPAAVLYERGLRVTCWMRACEDLTFLFYSLFLEHYSDWVNKRLALMSAHMLLLAALISAAITSSFASVLVVVLASGLVWANVFSIPYCLITFYGVGAHATLCMGYASCIL